MSYIHIPNLYRPEAQVIFLFKRCWCLEKIHGTSAKLIFNPKDSSIHYFSGGTKHTSFIALFHEAILIENFKKLSLPGDKDITVYGESYGGKEQGMSQTYGKVGKFIVFDVKIGDTWLDVPVAEKITLSLGLEFVYYTEVDTKLEILDALRDQHSVQSVRNGVVTQEDIAMGKGKFHEGIILRPLKEMTMNNGARVIAKHKRAEFSETATVRSVETDPARLQVLADADAIAAEWMTPNRFANARSHFKEEELVMENFSTILKYLVDDVLREAGPEIVVTPIVTKALSRKAAALIKDYIQTVRV